MPFNVGIHSAKMHCVCVCVCVCVGLSHACQCCMCVYVCLTVADASPGSDTVTNTTVDNAPRTDTQLPVETRLPSTDSMADGAAPGNL